MTSRADFRHSPATGTPRSLYNNSYNNAPGGNSGDRGAAAVPALPAVPAAIPYNPPRRSDRLFAFVLAVIAAGLLTRPAARFVPHFLTDALGDLLYAALFALLFAISFRTWPRWKVYLAAVGFCFAIEFSQLYQAPWLHAARETLPGMLILGRGFAPLDLLWYVIGAVFGVALVPRQPKVTRKFRSIAE